MARVTMLLAVLLIIGVLVASATPASAELSNCAGDGAACDGTGRISECERSVPI